MAASCCLRLCSGCILSCTHCSLTPAIKGANSTTRSKKSCLTCERRSSSARIRPRDSWCCPSAGSLSARWRGSTAAADSPRIGRTSIAQRSRFCASPQSGSCSENFVILTDVFGQTLRPCETEAQRLLDAAPQLAKLDQCRKPSIPSLVARALLLTVLIIPVSAYLGTTRYVADSCITPQSLLPR